MEIGHVDTRNSVLVIAEIGNNHEGSVERARELVAEAAAVGADAVKFQTYRTEHFISPADEARYERLERFRLTFDEFAELAELAREHGILFVSTPLDLESARFLDGIADGLKVASADNDFTPLLETVIATNKPVIISTGLTALEEIAHIARFVEKRRGSGDSCALLHCVSSYPTPDDEVNLRVIDALAAQFPGWTIGYSDHTLGIDAAVLSIAAGARVVEKHFTLDKQLSDFRDHQLSADPAEFRRLVEQIRTAERLAGGAVKEIQPSEQDVVVALRRSVATVHDLPAGHVLTADDLTWLRPGEGLRPGGETALIGRRLRRPLPRAARPGPDDVE